jgi:pimeloyl-ACP methyl ester carboxylesterase
MPVLGLHGAGVDHRRLLEHYPRATFAVLDRAGHGLAHEQVALVTALLAEWLDRVAEHRAATNEVR